MSDEEEIDFEALAEEALSDEAVAGYAEAARRSTLLPPEFWDASPVLGHVRDAALARLRSPDAVLAALLTRYAAVIPPSIVLPPIAGGVASLNMIVGIVSRAGAGKSSTVAVAAELLPIPAKRAQSGLPLGSGEGIAEAFFGYEEQKIAGKTKRVKVRMYDSVHLYVDEGATIVSLGQRNGSTTSSTLRTAWSGGTLGQTNASEEAKRVVPEHTYRLGLVAAFQYSNAAAVLDESDVGTPQRFLWAATEHPDIGTEHPDWPGELAMPNLHTVRKTLTHVQFDEAIVAEIRDAEILERSGRVEVDPLDTHRRMMKMKVATMLAVVITGKLTVRVEHWGLAETWLRCSDNIRKLIQTVHQANLTERARLRISQRVSEHRAILEVNERHAEEVASGRTVDCARKLTAKVWGGDVETIQEGRRAMRRYRDAYDEALDHALAEGWLTVLEKPGQGGSKRTLARGPVAPS